MAGSRKGMENAYGMQQDQAEPAEEKRWALALANEVFFTQAYHLTPGTDALSIRSQGTMTSWI